jgi:basic amino acid/polyamine antiporter, APA family
VFQILVGAALLYVPFRALGAYEASAFKLGRVGIKLSGWGLVLISAFFLIVVVMDAFAEFAWAGAYFLVGTGLYLLRRKRQESLS